MVGGIDDTRERVGFGVFVFDVSYPVRSAFTFGDNVKLCNSRQLLEYHAARTCSVKNNRRLPVRTDQAKSTKFFALQLSTPAVYGYLIHNISTAVCASICLCEAIGS